VVLPYRFRYAEMTATEPPLGAVVENQSGAVSA
jgi:hypothetical protein